MAYITKAEVKAKSKALALLNKLYGVKSSFSGSNSNCLTLTIHSGKIDFLQNAVDFLCKTPFYAPQHRDNLARAHSSGYLQVNHYYLERAFDGVALGYLQQAYQIMLDGHFDESDLQTDYFNCAWYNAIRIGRWDKPYTMTE